MLASGVSKCNVNVFVGIMNFLTASNDLQIRRKMKRAFAGSPLKSLAELAGLRRHPRRQSG